MKITKSQRSNIIFIAVLGILFFTPLGTKIKEYSARLLSFAPSVESVNERIVINDYEWKLKGINGQDIDFSEAKNKVIIVNFWATWCPPCRAEMPSLQELYDDYKDKVVFLFLTNEDSETVNKFLKKYEYNLPSYNQYTRTPKEFAVSSIPATYVIDKKGAIVVHKEGAAAWNSDKFRTILDKLITE